MFGAMDLGIADDGQRARREQAAQIAIALFADTAELVFAPLECCFGTSPIQAEKSRPDRKAFGSATLATKAVASAGAVIAAIRGTGRYGIFGRDGADHSALMPADRITLPHFSVSEARSLPNSAG